MATKININGEVISRPGVYSLIKSGIKNPPLNLSYGNICIIDTGIGAGYGGGAGAQGASSQGVNSIYEFNTIQDFRNFVKGGPLYDIALPLWKPAKNVNGVSKVFLVQGRSTTAASLTLTFTNSAAVVLKTKDEGINANGVLDTDDILKKGYACKFIASPVTADKYILQFYSGTYKDINANETYEPYLLFQSTEVGTIAELQAWFNTSGIFQKGFEVTSVTGSGAFVAADVTLLAGFQPFNGATESYTESAIDIAIAATKNTDCTFYLCTDYGDDATSLHNTKIFNFLIAPGKKYEKFMFVGGGADSSKRFGDTVGTSQYSANYYNSDRAIVVHGDPKITDPTAVGGFVRKNTLYKAAAALGRVCGLEPQTSLTLKTIDIAGEIDILNDDDQEFALSQGILYTYFDYELDSYVFGQGINTLLKNDFLVNEDEGSSFDIGVMRIKSQLNKEVVYNAKQTFFGKNVGPNRNTATEQDVKTWLIGFLGTKQASTLEDNLILSFVKDTITVTIDQDNYYITYEFVPNYPISKMIFTGVMLSA